MTFRVPNHTRAVDDDGTETERVLNPSDWADLHTRIVSGLQAAGVDIRFAGAGVDVSGHESGFLPDSAEVFCVICEGDLDAACDVVNRALDTVGFRSAWLLTADRIIILRGAGSPPTTRRS